MRWFYCLFLFASSQLLSAAKANPATDTIDHLLDGKDLDVMQSVHVVRLDDGKTLYEKNADLTLTPASVTKILTSATALSRYSPVHTFQTKLLAVARKGSAITGNLYLLGDGDPFLVSEKLWQMAADLKNSGIDRIDGDLVIDNSLFDGKFRDTSRKSGKTASHNAYDAPIAAFAINFNTYAVAVAPAEKAGAPAIVSLDPYSLPNVHIVNQVKTTSLRGKNLSVNRISTKSGDRITVSGTIGVDQPITKVYRSVGDNVEASGLLFKKFLESAGITVKGRITEGHTPNQARELMTLDSYDMSRIVAGLNTFSNNFIADMLLKRMGASFPKSGKPDTEGMGTYENGVDVIRRFLREDVGIKSPFVLNDGSGLSVDNRLSAHQLTQVLSYMAKHMEVFPEFFASLPATGLTGTMKKRFHKGDAVDMRGLFRAKTGTLSQPVSVAALAGYFRHPQHGLVAFSIIENGNAGKKQPAIAMLRDRQDEVMVSLMSAL